LVTENRPRKTKTAKGKRLSLWPLRLDEALGGAMKTGSPPEQPKRKRPAAKRRLKKAPADQG
jgi:hypothetical protein